MSDARAKQEGAAAQGPAPSAIPKSNPGRGTLTGGMEDGCGLPYRQKSLFESALGTDLSGVRVHTGDDAAARADQHDARAFAVGQDIHFAKGEYNPGTPQGDQLLAHEVAHTVQQRGAPAQDGEAAKTTTPGDSAESNADTAGAAMVQGAPAQVTSEPIAIARKGKNEPVAPPATTEAAPSPATAPGPDASVDAKSADGKPGDKAEIDGGDLSVERVGQEEVEGTEPVGPPQNLEAGKADLAAKGAALPPDGGAGELKGGGPKVEAAPGGGGGGGGGGPMTEETQLAISVAQADAKEGAAQAESEANAYKAQMNAERDRFDAQQSALTLEKLKEMTPADKRSTLVEMGYDLKSVKKMKDAEIDGLIAGRLETENRKTRILGMDEKELAALSPDRKKQFLVDLGVDKGDLDKIGPQKAAAAFDDVMRVAHIPGQHKVKVKIKGGLLKKSWEISVNVDAAGNPEFDVQKKGGFLSKLWGWVKAALPIIAVLLVPLTGGASLIALAVYQTVSAIAHGDWLGAIIGGAGAIVGIGALAGIKNGVGAAAKAFTKIADVADKVKGVATSAKAAMMAAKAKSPGGLMAALASGASSFADLAGKSAEKFAASMRNWGARLERWSKVVQGGESVVAGIKNGDPAAAVGGAFDAAAAAVSKPEKKADGSKVETSAKAKDFQRYSRIAGFASAGQRAAKSQPPDYGGVVDSAMGIAGELKESKRLEEATKITSAASRLTRAIQTKDPGQLAAAALGLAEAIHNAKYEHDGPEGADGKTPDDDREKVTKRFAQAASIIRFATAAIDAAAAKPRPSYTGALAAGTQLIAELTDNKKLDQAAVITSRLDAWTSAVQSKNEAAIIAAGRAFGEAINGMRDLIHQERDDAKKAAQANLKPGETLGEDDGGVLPSRSFAGLAELAPGVTPQGVDDGAGGLTPSVTTSEELKGVVPNYTVVPGDTLSGIAQRFHTTVATLRSTNPHIQNDRINIGQRIFVPGADITLTPSVTTDVSNVHVGGDGWNVTVPPGGNMPKPEGSGNKPFELPESAKTAVEIIRILADIVKEFGHPGAEAAFKEWDALVKAEKTAFEKKDATAWEKAKAGLSVLTVSADFKKAFSEEMAAFRSYFGNVDDSPAAKLRAKSGLQAIGRFKRNIGRVTRFGGIFTTFSSAADHLVIAAGYKADLSGAEASTLERVTAAAELAREVPQLLEDAKWALEMAGWVGKLVGAGQAVEGYEIVGRVANRYGAQVASTIESWVKPILQKGAAKLGGEAAREAAQRVAAEVAAWGAEFASSTTGELFKAAASKLGGRLVTALRIGASWEFMVAFEIAKLEARFAADLYDKCINSVSVVLSQKMYGSMIQIKKAEVRNWSTATSEDASATLRKCYTAFANAEKSDIRQGWPNYVQGELMRQGKWFAPFAGSADSLGKKLDEYWTEKEPDVRLVQSILLTYIDKTYRDVFHLEPPG